MAERDPLDPKYFNIDLLFPSQKDWELIGHVKNLDIFESNSTVFHPDGLFSTTIFGPIGSNLRLEKIGYIYHKLPVLHPLVFKHIKTLGKKYENILSGKEKYSFDKNTKDFVLDKSGDTGFEFFMRHINDIAWRRTDSKKRDMNISLLEMYANSESLLDRYIVIAAGLRDYGIDAKGKASQDEINDLYRRLLSITNMIKNVTITSKNIEQYNVVRYKIQCIVEEIYDYIFSLLDGKHKFIQGKWATREIHQSTRNVITSNPIDVTDLKSDANVTLNHTVCGMYQYLKAIGARAMFFIHNRFILGALDTYSNRARVIDKKTLETTFVEITTKEKEAWTTIEGLNNMFNKFKSDNIKDDYAMVGENGYMALVYDTGKEITVIKDTNNIPDYVNKSKLRPITYGELIYISIFDSAKDTPGLVTRYPVTGTGSIYPTYIYLKSTSIGRKVKIHIDNVTLETNEYPTMGDKYIASMSPHSTHLARLGADFDGDTCSLTVLLTKESREEVNKMLNSSEYYLSPAGELLYSIKTNTLEMVIKSLTKNPKGFAVK